MNIRRAERIIKKRIKFTDNIFSNNVTFYIRLTKFGVIIVERQHFVTRHEEPVVREPYTYFAQETDKHMVAQLKVNS